MMKNKKTFLIWLGTIILSGFLLFGVFFPVLRAAPDSSLEKLFFALYSPVCHQRPERSYQILGKQLAVCSRCLGVYLGFFLSAFFHPILKKKWKEKISRNYNLLIILALPMVADVLAGWLRLWESPLIIKTFSGLIWAFILPFFWFRALEELFA